MDGDDHFLFTESRDHSQYSVHYFFYDQFFFERKPITETQLQNFASGIRQFSVIISLFVLQRVSHDETT
jgi:hypothetical protein